MWSHGSNLLGALGNVSVANSSAIDIISTRLPLAAVSIAAVRAGAFAVVSNGSLYFWGTFPSGNWAPEIVPGALYPAPSMLPLDTTFGGPAPALRRVFTAPSYSTTYNTTIFLLDTSNQLYSFGANEYGQLCRGLYGYQLQSSPTAALVQLPPEFTVAEVFHAYSYSLILSSNGTAFGCGFNSNKLNVNRTFDNCDLGFSPCSNRTLHSVAAPIRMGVLPPSSSGDNYTLVTLSIGPTSALGATQAGYLVELVLGKFLPYSTVPILATRPIDAITTFGGGTLVSGLVSPRSASKEIPQNAKEIRIRGGGFPYIYRAIVPSDGLSVTLSEGSCTLTTTVLYRDPFDPDQFSYLVCTVDNNFVFTVGTNLTARLRVFDEVSPVFLVGTVVLPPVLNIPVSNYLVAGDPLYSDPTRVLRISGSNLGTSTRALELQISLTFTGADPAFSTPCTPTSATDTEITCEVQMPNRRADLVSIELTRLSASAGSSLPFARTMFCASALGSAIVSDSLCLVSMVPHLG